MPFLISSHHERKRTNNIFEPNSESGSFSKFAKLVQFFAKLIHILFVKPVHSFEKQDLGAASGFKK